MSQDLLEDFADKIVGATDGTEIGNVGDRLKVTTADRDLQHLEAGEAFCLGIEYVLNNAQTVYHTLLTPNTSTRIYLRFTTYSSDRTEIQFWEAPTITTYAFNWTPRDRNRETANTSATTVRAITTVGANGTFICKESNYGSGLATSQAPRAQLQEFILDQNTEYMFAMKSYAASNLTTLRLEWYEVP